MLGRPGHPAPTLIQGTARSKNTMGLPKPTPELREKVLKGECDPIRETIAKGMPGKAKPVLSIGPGKSTLVDGKPAKNPPRGLSSGVKLLFSRIDVGT